MSRKEQRRGNEVDESVANHLNSFFRKQKHKSRSPVYADYDDEKKLCDYSCLYKGYN